GGGGRGGPGALCCGVPELYTCASSGAGPLARRRIVELKIHSGRVVLTDVGIDCQHLLIGQKRPSFLVIDVELVFASRCPSQSVCVEESCLVSAAIGLHERSVEENHTLGIADRSRERTKAREKRRRCHESPSVCQGVIDGALI